MSLFSRYSVIAVSYTHLDVYKRQILVSVVKRAKKVIPEIEGCRAFPEKKVKREMLA